MYTNEAHTRAYPRVQKQQQQQLHTRCIIKTANTIIFQSDRHFICNNSGIIANDDGLEAKQEPVFAALAKKKWNETEKEGYFDTLRIYPCAPGSRMYRTYTLYRYMLCICTFARDTLVLSITAAAAAFSTPENNKSIIIIKRN